jgi:integrase
VERRKDRTRTRVLTADEIRQLWQATADNSDYSAILRLLLLSGCRASEIAGLQWSSEVLADRIVLPPERTKNGRGHVIPLTPTMRAILDGREHHPGKDYIFGRAPDRPFSGWGASKEALDARLPIAPWVTHDLRRTCATHLGELGIAPHVIAAALNHVSGGGITGRVYNLAKLEEPVRNALLAWDAHVIAIVGGRLPRDKRVVPLKK